MHALSPISPRPRHGQDGRVTRITSIQLGSFIVGLLLLVSGCEDKSAVSPLEGLRIVKERPEYMILDVRSVEEFAQGHYARAVNIPMEALEMRVKELPADRPVLLYCAVGKRARTAQVILWKARPDLGPVLRIQGKPLPE